MKTKIITLAIVTCCWACLNQAQAVPITIEIGGEITGGYGTLWGGDIYVGAGFTGTYTYDSAAPNTSTSSQFGVYVFDSPYGISISIGGLEFTTSQNHTGQFKITISDNGPNADSYNVQSYQNVNLSNGAIVEYIGWGLHGPNSTISSIGLPTTAPVMSQWGSGYLQMYGEDIHGNMYNINGTVTQATPEPATSSFLLTAGVFLLRRRR